MTLAGLNLSSPGGGGCSDVIIALERASKQIVRSEFVKFFSPLINSYIELLGLYR